MLAPPTKLILKTLNILGDYLHQSFRSYVPLVNSNVYLLFRTYKFTKIKGFCDVIRFNK